jgi:lysozyme
MSLREMFWYVCLLLCFPAGLAIESTRAEVAPVAPVSVSSTSPCCSEIREKAKAMLREHEGLRLSVYTDTVGQKTIGYGHATTRLEHITREQAETLLDDDLTAVLEDVAPMLEGLPEKAQLTLIDLRYNCGAAGFRTFVNTLKSIKSAQYHDAAARLATSQWAAQVGTRAVKVINMLKELS